MKNNFNIEEVKNFWDSIAIEYDRINKKIGRAHFQRFTESIDHLDLKDNDKVLNIWSRTGNGIGYLQKTANIELINLEVSPKMIEIAKKKFPDCIFQETDLIKLNFPDNYFDSIISLETLEHSPEPLSLLKEFYRVLKPNKRLVMSLPPKTAELPLRIYETFFENHGEGPHNFLASKIVIDMLKQSGFKLKLHKGTLLIPAGPQFIQIFGEWIIEKFQNTKLKEFGIRQFYICEK